MTTIEYLERQYNHAFDMVKFGETKNIVLIALNVAIMVGMAVVANDTTSIFLYYFLLYAIIMCGVSLFIAFSAFIAKIKHTGRNTSLKSTDNLLFFATLAHMTHEDLLKTLKFQYHCESSNANHEMDLARQVIITSQIAESKFKMFNTAIAFTFSGLFTPLSIIAYNLFIDRGK